MSLNWNFQRGGGSKQKNLPWGEYGYFLKQHSANEKCSCKHDTNTAFLMLTLNADRSFNSPPPLRFVKAFSNIKRA